MPCMPTTPKKDRLSYTVRHNYLGIIYTIILTEQMKMWICHERI